MGNTRCYAGSRLRFPVHPHACGEHDSASPVRRPPNGSSPRLWGTPFRLFFLAVTNRFIPTPVGNTIAYAAACWSWSVHPHACGEHRYRHSDNIVCTGSSPRLWGTRINFVGDTFTLRFIPTPVGNTYFHTRHSSIMTVHPHACGEHFLKRFSLIFLNGSSPRLWGTPNIIL